MQTLGNNATWVELRQGLLAGEGCRSNSNHQAGLFRLCEINLSIIYSLPNFLNFHPIVLHTASGGIPSVSNKGVLVNRPAEMHTRYVYIALSKPTTPVRKDMCWV